MMPSPPLFLGLDLSTQRLKAILISEDSRVIHTCTVGYDEELPSHMTTKGAIFGPSGEITSPVLMWLEALDLLFDKMKCAGVDFGSISCVAGAAQVRDSISGTMNTV
jgi:xylulokinase